MRLRKINLHRYRQFIDESIRLDPKVTVIVGRNDTGKTSFIDRFFDQYAYGSGIHSADRPNVPSHAGQNIHYSLEWHVSPEDYSHFPLLAAFGSHTIETMEIEFDENNTHRYWRYTADGRSIDPYEGVSSEGFPVMREPFKSHRLFPRHHRINLPDNRILESMFEARFYQLPIETIEREPHQRPSRSESLLLRLGGLRAMTRSAIGTEKPWEDTFLYPPTLLGLAQIEKGLQLISERVTEKLRRWWQDPPGLSFRIRLTGDVENQHRINSYILPWEILDESNARYYGTGLLWFTTLLIELLFLEDQKEEVLIVMDEPATPLHPSAQHTVSKLLGELSSHHQIIYTTHSPFMIDWNFPQRVRLFRREYETRRARIDNTPYRPTQQFERIWDPLRSSIGVTLGDVAVVGDYNLLVEGVSDQILLANLSAFFQENNEPHFDLTKTSVVPFGEEPVLYQILSTVRQKSARGVVLIDSDEQGQKVIKYCQRENVFCLEINSFVGEGTGDAAIEDLIGIRDYTVMVNEFYTGFDWFSPLTVEDIQSEISGRSLGKYLDLLFGERFNKDFSKVALAVFIADNLHKLSNETLGKFAELIESVQSIFSRTP